jgi:outer membrane protein TolC
MRLRKMINKVKWLLAILLLSTFTLSAQQSNEQGFSLNEALSYAMVHSYISKNADIDVISARKQVWESISTGLPQVDGIADYNVNLDLPVSLIPSEFIGGEPGTYIPVKFGQDYNSTFGVTVSQLIFDGVYLIGLKAAKVYVDLALGTQEKTQIEIREFVTDAYYSVLIAEKFLATNKDNLDNSQKLYSDTEAYYKNGFAEEQDVDQLRLMVKQTENELIKAERSIRVTKMVLKYVMGVDVNDEIVLADSLENFVDPVIKAGTVARDFDYSKHVDYRILETQYSLKKSQLDLEKVSLLPKIDVFYSWMKTAYANDANLIKEDWYPSSMIGFKLSLPIFSSGGRLKKIQRAKLELEKKENERLMNIQNLQMEYITAYTDLESALDKFKNDEENNVIAQRIYKKTQIKFNNGISTSTELSQNETQYLQSYSNYLLSMMELLKSKMNLDKAVGEL